MPERIAESNLHILTQRTFPQSGHDILPGTLSGWIVKLLGMNEIIPLQRRTTLNRRESF